MLLDAKKAQPDAFELHLKIERELQQTSKYLAGLSEQDFLTQAIDEKSAAEAQIKSLSNELIAAVEGMPKAQAAIRKAISKHSE